MKTSANQDVRKLLHVYDTVSEGCVECGLCQKDCRFLQQYGSPKQIAGQRSTDPVELRTSFECNLCWLCTAVCPKDIDPAAMFLSMRRKASASGNASFNEHGTILRYERWGMKPAISWYGLPDGCDTVLFPGCAMAGSRSGRVIDLYSHLKKYIPSLGVVLDCCTKPSHDLGRAEYFAQQFASMRSALADQGVERILVACPSCYRVWKDYGDPIKVSSIYEQLAESGPVQKIYSPVQVRVHDPCPTRYDLELHNAVRKLLVAMGFSLKEMKHNGRKTLCCGEGGAACYVAPEFAGNWTATRAREADEDYMVTYCAGCTHFLGKLAPVGHIADLFFEPKKTMAGKVQTAGSPMTWLNRLLLKRKLKRLVAAKISGSRDSEGRVLLK